MKPANPFWRNTKTEKHMGTGGGNPFGVKGKAKVIDFKDGALTIAPVPQVEYLKPGVEVDYDISIPVPSPDGSGGDGKDVEK